MPHDDAVKLIQLCRKFPIQSVTVDILDAALASVVRFQISYWDAAFIEAARALRCETVLSEDMSDGQNYGGVHVLNPFVHAVV